MAGQDITSVLNEKRVFEPPAEFVRQAHVRGVEDYERLYKEAEADPDTFWARAAEAIPWTRRWDKVCDWSGAPFAKWFVGGQTNASVACVDRHLTTWRKNKAAIVWEGEPGEVRTLTYQQLHVEVCRFANVLRHIFGVEKGDRVAIYMPLVPELPIAMLACARIGAIHTVVFGGFSAEALKDRINDAKARVVVTADGGYRRGAIVPLKVAVDDAVKDTPSVKGVVVFKRTGHDVPMHGGRDYWWNEVMAAARAECPPEALDSEHPLYTLYTSGTTGKPKGILHTTAGYLVQTTLSMKWVFDLKDEDLFWCTADIGWVTGHSYVVYGPLSNGATVLMYEGAPNWPEPDRFWSIVERHRVNTLYTAPTAIRAFIKWGDQWPLKHDLSSLRLLGTVGEPINPEAWMWYQQVIGKGRCPIVDTWWQTETGSILITPLPGAIASKPGSATRPFPGILADVVDDQGNSVPPNTGGRLVIKRPWPSMLRTIYGDPDRFKQQYWSQFPGLYYTGDGARRDEDGYFWLMGRLDDVIKVSG
ncbi:MAG: acetate--CoA ligase, partial [Planctomycetota bacterium]